MGSRKRRRLARFVEVQNWPLLNSEISAGWRSVRGWLVLAALSFGILAAARPAWGTRERLVTESGIDLIVALDVSQSMLAVDRPQQDGQYDAGATRLAAAKSRLRQVAASLGGHRVALVPFAGDAFLQCPLTTDKGIFLDVLNASAPDSVGLVGTDIGRAIAVAREAFAGGGTGSRVLLLVTDGEDHGGGAVEQARAAAREGVRIYALGIGSEKGGPIILPDGRIKNDAQGFPIVSRLDTQMLEQLASETGGTAYVSESGAGLDVRPLIAQLDALERGEYSEETRVVREERFQIPLALAVMCLLAEGFISDRKRRARVGKPVEVRAT
jgi:Ca-activated chloride channel family protein